MLDHDALNNASVGRGEDNQTTGEGSDRRHFTPDGERHENVQTGSERSVG
jgi:hypothetical protein